MTQLCQRMIEYMQLRGYSARTQEAYLRRAATAFSRIIDCSRRRGRRLH